MYSMFSGSDLGLKREEDHDNNKAEQVEVLSGFSSLLPQSKNSMSGELGTLN